MAGGEGCRDERRGSSASEVGTVDGTAKKKKKVLLEGYTSIAITMKEQHHMVGQKCEVTSKVFSSKYNTQHLHLCFMKLKLKW